MIKPKKDGLLIVISGPSGAGKGTICNQILKNDNVWKSVSMTTRLPRDGEVEGIDYFYVTKEQFEDKIAKKEMLEYAEVYNGIYYGTPKDEVLNRLEKGMDVILEIDIEGALNIKKEFNSAICIFIMPPSMKELKNRLIKRNTETKEKLLERFKKAYREVNQVSKYNYVVINDEVDNAVNKIESILLAEKCRVDRIMEVDLGNEEEELHELLVDKED